MIPYLLYKIKPKFIRNFAISSWIEAHKSRWEVDGFILDLSSISNYMLKRITKGTYEKHEMQLCRTQLKSSDRVLEIGSAIGFISLYCQKKIGIKKIFCVEPNPETARHLRSNYSLNGLEVNMIEGCFAKADGIYQLAKTSEFWADRIITENTEQNELIDVRGLTLSSILNEIHFRPNVLIIDVEGAEIHLDASDVPNYVEKIIMEIHPRICGFDVSYKHLSKLIMCGFSVVEVAGDVYALERNTLNANFTSNSGKL